MSIAKYVTAVPGQCMLAIAVGIRALREHARIGTLPDDGEKTCT